MNTAHLASPAEAVYGFAAWLTTLDPPLTFGKSFDAGMVAELADNYTKSQGWEPPREDMLQRLRTMPASDSSGWQEEARRFCANADHWRQEAGRLESEQQAIRRERDELKAKLRALREQLT